MTLVSQHPGIWNRLALYHGRVVMVDFAEAPGLADGEDARFRISRGWTE